MKQVAIEAVERLGFAVIPGLLTEELRRELVALFDGREVGAGRRDGLSFEAVRAAATSGAVCKVVRAILGRGAFAIKATLFDKTPSTNWLVPWHQDLMIPVLARQETLGFEAWSIKEGIQHVRPPAGVLQSMVALRLDLDGTTAVSGALRVIPGSHDRGILGTDEIQRARRSRSSVECLVPRCGGLLMRPLLLHASSRALCPGNRRIVHLEFSAGQLPGGLEWGDHCVLEEPPQSS